MISTVAESVAAAIPATVSVDTVIVPATFDAIESAALNYGTAGDLASSTLADLALAILSVIPVDAVEPRKSVEFGKARDSAMAGFRKAFLARPRFRDDGTAYDLALCESASADTVTDKEVRGWAKDDPRREHRKAVQGYGRTRWMRAMALAWPKAGDDSAGDDSADSAAPVESAPIKSDPTSALAGITATLVGLSQSDPDAARALLNGLDSLVKYARPYIAEGKAIPVA
jgi:hypothetical protein